MNQSAVTFLANMLIQTNTKREPDFIIGPKENPYLKRWWLQRTYEEGCIYLHQILKDDDDRALHDHPWDNVSIVLEGNLIEVLPGNQRRLLIPGEPVARKASDSHRLELADPSDPVWTLFITGPAIRSWGFHCPKGWVPWREFVLPSEPGLVGRGCGED